MYRALIRKYFVHGYGLPVRRYTKDNLDAFVKSGLITEEQKEEILSEREEVDENAGLR